MQSVFCAAKPRTFSVAKAAGRATSIRLEADRAPHPQVSAVGLALWLPAVAADVAVLAADDYVDRVLGVAEVSDRAHCCGVDPGEAARPKLVAGVVAELDRDPAAVEEVELLLLVGVVATGLGRGGGNAV